MTWNDITVFQWQQLNDLFLAEHKDVTELDLSVKAAAICTGMTEHQIDSLSISELNPILQKIEFIHKEIKPQAAKYIDVNGRRYKCVYDIRKMPAARYIETKHFGKDVNGNLHRIAACMVLPMKKTFFGWKVAKYNAADHEQYANDMLEAKVINVLGSVVFFYQVFRLWTKSSKDYLTSQMMKGGMTKYQAEVLHQALCKVMDGYIRPHWLPTMKKSHWSRYMKSAPYNS